MNLAFISVHGTKEPERTMYEKLLYNMLKSREPYMNISHKKMPTYFKHVEFVRSQPYKGWFIVQDRDTNRFVGSIYLTKEDEIGIFLFKEFRHQGYGTELLNFIMEYYKHVKELLANIAPTNSGSMCFFLNRGFKFKETHIEMEEDIEKVIQHTYSITNPFYELLDVMT